MTKHQFGALTDRVETGTPPDDAWIVDSPLQIDVRACFLRLTDLCSADVYLKLEGLNPAGSIKLRPALRMIESLEAQGRLRVGHHHVIESSSGNLGIALSLVCKVKGYPFTCITDPNANRDAVRLMKAYGATVIVINERDAMGGYLGARIARIRQLVSQDPTAVWTNQYANPANAEAHDNFTAPAIHSAFPDLDYLFVGAGTTGTLVGCAMYFARHHPSTKVIAVDAAGSVTFGGMPGPRLLPGIGTSHRPDIADLRAPDEVVQVSEQDAVRTCHGLLERFGLLAGASTGSVISAIETYPFPPGRTVVAISPDFGERYLDTLYDPEWVESRFPALAGFAPIESKAS